MAIRYWEFVRNQEKLAEALQVLTKQERGELPVIMKTPAERRKSAQKQKRLERTIERRIERERKHQERTKKICVGEY